MDIKTVTQQEVGEGKAHYNSTINPAALIYVPLREKGVVVRCYSPCCREERRLIMVMASKDGLKQIHSRLLS